MLPQTLHNLTLEKISEIEARVKAPFYVEARRMKIDNNLGRSLAEIYIPLAAMLERSCQNHTGALVVGINGAQGAGKSTFCRLLQIVLEHGFKLRATTLSIDDLYLTRAERQVLAQQVHPLLATRGVPGTHDVNLGLRLLDELKKLRKGQILHLPVFNKAIDERSQPEQWCEVQGPLNLILFEGWCVGARPQPDTDLIEPINTLEREEDPDLTWRRYVNRQLQRDYSRLFAEIDTLIMLKVPGMESVHHWRSLQEKRLAAASGQPKQHKIMDATALYRFIMHYERLTLATLKEMPDRAELVLELNAEHRIHSVKLNLLNGQN